MAHIKCRYSIPYCTIWGCCDYTRLEWDDRNHCFDKDECWCDGGVSHYERPRNADPNNLFPLCDHVQYQNGEFEKTVRRYEYTPESGLYFSEKEYYNASDIDYLEIDGRILVGGDDHE